MSASQAVAAALGLGSGALTGLVVARSALRRQWRALVRVNLRGREVPAVLGIALVAGTLTSLAALGLYHSFVHLVVPPLLAAGVVAAAAIMFAGGLFDDLRGDETPRGFSGHAAALRGGALTGGLVKAASGAVAGGAAGALTSLAVRGHLDAPFVFEVAGVVALSANLFNLLDRAPGRAGKTGVLVALVLVLLGDAAWAIAASGLMGAVAVVLPYDLRERGMLGDAGANPLGAVLGLGVAVSVSEPVRIAAVAVLVVLNLVSERWSFSRVIESSAPLRALDRLGRK
jgi:Glycosyl transferase family 4